MSLMLLSPWMLRTAVADIVIQSLLIWMGHNEKDLGIKLDQEIHVKAQNTPFLMS